VNQRWNLVLNPEMMSMQKGNCSSVCPNFHWLKNSTNQISGGIFFIIHNQKHSHNGVNLG
jgi:hypothetical protein